MARPRLVKVLKLLAFVLGGVVALAVLLAVTASLLFDAEAVKAQAARLMMDKKQRILKIEGEAALSFWPGVGLRLSKVSLSEPGSEQVFAAAEKVRLSLRLLPLLKKALAVDTVELDGIFVNLIHHKDGSFNFDDLISQEKDQKPLRFDVQGVRLRHGKLSYVDEGAGRTVGISDLDLGTGQLANIAKGQLSLNGKLTMDKPVLAGDIHLISRYRLDLEKKTYALDGLDVRSSSDYLGMKGAELALWADLLSASPTGMEAIKLELGAKGNTGDQTVEAKLSVPKLLFGGGKAAGESLSLTAALSGESGKTSAQVSLAGIALDGRLLDARKFSLAAESRKADASYRLNFSSPLMADLGGQVFTLPQIAGDMEIHHPALVVKPLLVVLTGSLEADAAKSVLSASLNARSEPSHLVAKIQIPHFSPLSISFALDLDQLNADKYLAPAKAQTAQAANPQEAAKPLDFAFLNTLDANGTLKVGVLQYSGVKASNLRLELRARNGHLDLSPLSANFYQGSIAGSVALDAKDNKLAVRQNLTGVAVSPLLKDVLHKDFLEGRGNLSLDLHTAGQDIPAMTQALAGTARMDLKDGAVKGINLAKSLRDLKSRLIQRQDMVQAANSADKTDFTELSASFDVAAGIARNKDLSAKSPFLRLTGAGQFDLPKKTLDYTAKVAIVPTAAGQMGKDLADLRGLTIPIHLSGPFQAPSYRLAFSDVISEALTGKAQVKVDEVKERAREAAKNQIGSALKGLLGR
jgi:AsmA protein